MSITKSDVIQTASKIADERGFDQVSLKTVAEQLGIRTPSLYNHISSLDELRREIAHENMRVMNTRLMQSAVGVAGDDAIKAVGTEYLNFMIEHPGVYETIQWVTWHETEKTTELLQQYHSLLSALIHSCHFTGDSTNDIENIIAGMLHGYTTLQLRYAFSEPQKVQKQLQEALDILLAGLHQKYGS